ncbi:MAG: hypothetical protein ACI8P9_001037 [Parasphingorhabdus sp.]|jgi:hypothetical protein
MKSIILSSFRIPLMLLMLCSYHQAGAQSSDNASQQLVEGATALANGMRETRRYQHLLEASTGQNVDNMLKLSGSVRTLGKLSKLGAGLGVGLAMVDAFGAFGPSADEQMMDALVEITSKLDKLQLTLDTKLVDMENNIINHIQREAAKTQIRSHVGYLTTLQGDIDYYRTALQSDDINYDILDEAERTLSGYSSEQVKEHAEGIYANITGGNLATNIMQQEYIATYGSLEHIKNVGMMLTELVQSSQAYYELIKVIQLRRGNEADLLIAISDAEQRVRHQGPLTYGQVEAISNHSSNAFNHILEAIADEMDNWILKGISERSENVRNYLQSKIGGTGHIENFELSPNNVSVHESEPFIKTFDYESETFSDKYGINFAEELKRIYMADFMVMSYRPYMTPGYDNAHPDFFHIKGNNMVWFFGQDYDFAPALSGTNPHHWLFLLVKWSDIKDSIAQPEYDYAFNELDIVDLETSDYWYSDSSEGNWQSRFDLIPGLSDHDLKNNDYPIKRDVDALFNPLNSNPDRIYYDGKQEPMEDSGLVLEIRANPHTSVLIDTHLSVFIIDYEGDAKYVESAGNSHFLKRTDGDRMQAAWGQLYLTTTAATRLAAQESSANYVGSASYTRAATYHHGGVKLVVVHR